MLRSACWRSGGTSSGSRSRSRSWEYVPQLAPGRHGIAQNLRYAFDVVKMVSGFGHGSADGRDGVVPRCRTSASFSAMNPVSVATQVALRRTRAADASGIMPIRSPNGNSVSTISDPIASVNRTSTRQRSPAISDPRRLTSAPAGAPFPCDISPASASGSTDGKQPGRRWAFMPVYDILRLTANAIQSRDTID